MEDFKDGNGVVELLVHVVTRPVARRMQGACVALADEHAHVGVEVANVRLVSSVEVRGEHGTELASGVEGRKIRTPQRFRHGEAAHLLGKEAAAHMVGSTHALLVQTRAPTLLGNQKSNTQVGSMRNVKGGSTGFLHVLCSSSGGG